MRQNKLTPVIAHAAGWLFFFSLVLGFLYDSHREQSVFSIIFSWTFLVFGIVYLFLFYFNTYFLIPEFYLKKKYLVYLFLVLLLFAAVYFIMPFDRLMGQFRVTDNRIMQPSPFNEAPPGFLERQPPPPGRPGATQTDIVSIVLFVTVWSLSTAMCIIRQWRLTEKRALQAEAEKANAELSFLKAQINPHFLFNTLNNIYSLVITKNDKAADGVMKLSNIMRYITDEVRENYVSLSCEIDCMRDYIDLQKLRLANKMNVELLVKGNANEKMIAPLLLMTFVENAFKYGVSNHEPSSIIIRISIEQNNISFFCQNKLFEIKNNESTGIGISNARKRLQHLYPGKHQLEINTQNELFIVRLILEA
ncbi:MAG: histidine kinase [Chitinophagaceae bacterium]|nr:histidine kinase [Chitinophagaceae bacterium]